MASSATTPATVDDGPEPDQHPPDSFERTVELVFACETVRRTITLGPLANDDVVVEAARAEVVAERPTLGRFRRGRVVG